MAERKYTVYIHTNKINNKSYVGITCQRPEIRWGQRGQNYIECPYFWHAIQKYGWNNFDHTILYQELTHDEACAKEIELIAEKQQTDPRYGYNISAGGDGVDPDTLKRIWQDESYRAFASERMREAWTDPQKRKRRSDAAKKRWSNPSFKENTIKQVIKACGRSVTCVETGETFQTLQDAQNHIGVSKSNIHRAIKTGYKCGGYHWKYTDDVSIKA